MTFRILHVNTSDIQGGAALVAWNLHQACLAQGMTSTLAVGYKRSADPTVQVIDHVRAKNYLQRNGIRLARGLERFHGRVRGAWTVTRIIEALTEPGRYINVFRGGEDFDFPGTWNLLSMMSPPPQLLHGHNLHGGYFDLRALAPLSRQIPVLLTLHDNWMLSGHCSYSLNCERWKTGCGECPYLSVYPSVRRDRTAVNWKNKATIYRNARFYIATPSKWLMDMVGQSMLAERIIESRIIPNGVDQTIFRPVEKNHIREQLGIRPDQKVLLFSGYRLQSNPFKDYETLQNAFEVAAKRNLTLNFLLLVLGEEQKSLHIGQSEIRFIPYLTDPASVARYYQAADVYVHSSKADTFPTAILEALSCGVPVVASNIGGIPEQINTGEDATGVLVNAGDVHELANSMERVLLHDAFRQRLAENASRDAMQRFGLENHVRRYLNWYNEILLK